MSISDYNFKTPGSLIGDRRSQPTRLSALELRNFKSIKSERVHIKPLTIVAGSNSAGKSSLLQAILAFTQVSRRRIDGNRFPLNDDLTRLGTFTALRHQRSSEEEPIEVTLEFESQLLDIEMRRLMWRSNRSLRQKVEDFDKSKIRWSVQLDSQVEGQVGAAQISALCISINTDYGYQSSARVTCSKKTSHVESTLPNDEKDSLIYHGEIFYCPFNEEGDEYLESKEKINIADTEITSGQITSFFISPPEPSKRVEEWFATVRDEPSYRSHKLRESSIDINKQPRIIIRRAIRDIIGGRPARSHSDTIQAYRELDERSQANIRNQIIKHFIEQKNEGNLDKLTNDVAVVLEGAQRYCAKYLANSVYYVGPLRHAPHLPFTSAPDPDTGSVGAAGEHVAAVLQAKRGMKKEYPLPPSQDAKPLTLEEAVNEWLRFLEIAESLTVYEGTPLVYNIDLVPKGLDNKVPLKAVGVGVSQILPIIVQCLVAGPGALVILEQPELHLHPSAQQRLADFLIACTDWGQHILIESHSEYLVLRMRRRVAEDLSNKLRDQIGVLFAKRDEQGNTTYREVEITDAGGVVEWPEGFFDQSQDEAHELLIAAVNRQQQAEKTTKPSPLA